MKMPDSSIPAKKWLWLLLAVFTLTWFTGLGFRPLSKTDEGRYAEISREMVVSGDWLTPRLNGLKYFEKPPLQYWTTAIAFKAFGFEEWAARLWTGLCGFASVLMTAWIAFRLYGARVGLYAGAIAGSSLSFFLMGHINALDMGFTAMLTGALACLIGANTTGSSQAQRRWMLLCWAAMALAVLSKGLAGLVLPGMVLVVYCLLARDLSTFTRAQWLWGPILFLIIASPWFIAVNRENPGFAEFFFIHEHFDRFAKDGHRRNGPIWYFVPQLLVGLMPWTALLLGINPIRFFNTDSRFKPALLLLLWATLIFAFFSLSKSKLPSYIVPVFPALAVLMAKVFDDMQDENRRRFFFWMMLLIMLAIGLMIYTTYMPGRSVSDIQFAFSEVGGLVLLCSGAIIGRVLNQNASGKTPSLIALAIGGTCLNLAVVAGYQAFGDELSAAGVGRALKDEIAQTDPVYSVDTYEQSLPFYLGRTVTLVDYRDEFDMGLKLEPEKGIPSIERFIDTWNKQGQAWAYMRPGTYQQLRQLDVPMQLRYNKDEQIMVSRQ